MGKNILIYSTQNSILGLQLICNLHTCEINLLLKHYNNCAVLTRENLFCAIYPCRAKWPLLLVILGI